MPVLDRIVELQSLRETRDRFGGVVESWREIEKVWASVRQTGTSENFQNDADRAIALRNATMRIRWREDVQETGRVVYDGLPWDIKGIAEVGFRRELDLICQTDVDRGPVAFTVEVDQGRVLLGGNTLVTWAGDTDIIWRGI